jgi:ribosomal-protein-alanine N-acetyltransferase
MSWLPQRARTYIAEAGEDDLDRLAEIHAEGFAGPWSVEDFGAFLGDPRVICLVMRRIGMFGAGRTVGFVLVRTAADEAEILSIAVERAARGYGFGRRLLEEAMRRLYRERTASLFLEVDEDNAAALHLYRRLGFEKVGERTGYYAEANGRRGTALVMRAQVR